MTLHHHSSSSSDDARAHLVRRRDRFSARKRTRSRRARLAALATIVSAIFPAAVLNSNATAEEVPDPIEPTAGEAHLLELIDGLPLNDIEQALDHFPIPYVVVATAGGAPPTIVNQRAGTPVRIDADQSKTTGQGGNDVLIEVNTEVGPTPHLVLDIERLGDPLYASAVSVVVVFPFSAFNDESLPAAPNVFFGYSTDYGRAPDSVQMTLTPGVLAGTSHLVDLDVATVGETAPVRFVAGHFDGDPGTAPVNAMALTAHTYPVPDEISIGLGVSSSPIGGGATTSTTTLDWDATEPTDVTFDFLENEGFPFSTPDYGTSIVVDQMPTQESITLSTDLVAGTVGISHRASDPIDELRLAHTREDGYTVRAFATDVPTEVDVEIGTNGTASLDVNDDTLDLTMAAMQDGGFPGTGAFFGHDLGYVELGVENAPDLTAAWDAATTAFSAQTTEPGTSADEIRLVIDDDAVMGKSGAVFGRDLPEAWNPYSSQHVVSLIDDGTHGTAAARAFDVSAVALGIDPSPIAAHVAVATETSTPLHANVLTTAASTVIPADVDVRCDVEDLPAGLVTLDLGFPPPTIDLTYDVQPAADIDAVTCTGSVGTLNFELGLADVPAEFGIQFDPESSLQVIAGNGVDPAPSATVGRASIRLWDEDGLGGLPDTSGLVGAPLRDAVARVDDVPSFSANWSDGASGTSVGFDTVAASGPWQYLGGAQVQVSTVVGLAMPDAPNDVGNHYLTLVDEGLDAPKRLMAGVFGIDTVSMSTTDGGGQHEIEAHYAADEDRQLVVHVDSEFGGRFFPDYRFDATVLVDDVPQTWDFSTDLTSTLEIEGSGPVERIAFDGAISQQRELPEPEEGEEPPTPVYDTTEIYGELLGVPTELDYLVDLTPEGQAYLHLGDPIDDVFVEVWGHASNGSHSAILGTDYAHLRLVAEDVPASFDADWGSGPGLYGSLTTSAPLGPVELVVSKFSRSLTTTVLESFAEPNAVVEYTDFTREIDRRYWRQGPGDDADREPLIMNRLDRLYDEAIALDEDEDHLVMLQNAIGELEFLSVRGTGFENLTVEVTDVATAQLSIPFAGDHPFFVGLQDETGEHTLVQIPNIPDTTTIEVGADHAHVDFDGSPGDIVVYQGPLGTADVYADITKVIVNDAPTSVHADWAVGSEGSLALDVSNPVTIQMLTQNGNGRTVVDLGVDDLNASYTTSDTQVDGLTCTTAGCGTHVIFAEVTLDITTGSPFSGLIAHYDRTAGPTPLDPGGPSHDFVEMVPRVTAIFDGFDGIHATTKVGACLFGACLAPFGYWATLGVDLDGLNVDFWDRGGALIGGPDYVDNDPWHLVPLAHDADEHILPAHLVSPV